MHTTNNEKPSVAAMIYVCIHDVAGPNSSNSVRATGCEDLSFQNVLINHLFKKLPAFTEHKPCP